MFLFFKKLKELNEILNWIEKIYPTSEFKHENVNVINFGAHGYTPCLCPTCKNDFRYYRVNKKQLEKRKFPCTSCTTIHLLKLMKFTNNSGMWNNFTNSIYKYFRNKILSKHAR